MSLSAKVSRETFCFTQLSLVFHSYKIPTDILIGYYSILKHNICYKIAIEYCAKKKFGPKVVRTIGPRPWVLGIRVTRGIYSR